MPRGKTGAATAVDNPNYRYRNLPKNIEAAPDWIGADPAQLGAAVLSVAHLGDAILIAATSDRGALKLLILAGDEKLAHYCARAQDVDAVTDALQKLDE